MAAFLLSLFARRAKATMEEMQSSSGSLCPKIRKGSLLLQGPRDVGDDAVLPGDRRDVALRLRSRPRLPRAADARAATPAPDHATAPVPAGLLGLVQGLVGLILELLGARARRRGNGRGRWSS